MNILELFRRADKTALIQNGERVSYKELSEQGLRFGGFLRDNGIKSNSYILVFIPLSIELYIAMVGAWSIGAVPIFIDFSRGAKFVNDSIDRLKPDIIVCDGVTGIIKNGYSKMRKIKTVKVNGKGDPVSAEKLDENHPAILSFTSGTTGLPKIAERTHGFLIDQYHALIEHIDFNENHIDLGTLPVFTLANMAAGMTTLLPDKSYRSKINSAKLARQMQLQKVSRTICSPALMRGLLKHGDFPNLKNVYLGGGPVYPSLLKNIREDIDLHIVYGSTEAEPISGIRWEDVNHTNRQKINEGAGLPVGHVVPGVECIIGEEQEILVSGKTVLKGYMNGVGDSENKIHQGDKVWHRTGDAGYFDEQGCLWLLGRVSQAINDEFGTLYPFGVECILDFQFGIRGAVLLQDKKRIVVVEKSDIAPETILKFLKSQRIEKVAFVKKIPMDKRHSAKIDYARLQNMI
ncbi:MAG: AMP-binding protein [Oscillospiraceae bacterium]|nr:AMP-binding protein [Oscillospiraceae bacterium]